jgi:DNA-binding MarR family transcriptional regulator
MERDSVDRHVEKWTPERPGLDPRVEAIVARMQSIVRHLRRTKEQVLKERDLHIWEWELLHALREDGEPYRAAPTALAARTGVPATTMTSRLGRLEARGFVRRTHDTGDRRRLLVELTDSGHTAWEGAISIMGGAEKNLLTALGAAEQDCLADLLRPLMLEVDRQA